MNNNQQRQGSSNRGFSAMDPDEQREIASEGGKAAHESGNVHEFKAGSEEAREAGKKGGQAQGKENNPGNFANDREKASEAGKTGGSR